MYAKLCLIHVCRSGGGEFSLPGNLALSLQQLLHSLDCACAESEVDCSSGGERKEEALIRQDHLLDCIMSYVTRYVYCVRTAPYTILSVRWLSLAYY